MSHCQLVAYLGTNIGEILIEIQMFSFKKMHSSRLQNVGHFVQILVC